MESLDVLNEDGTPTGQVVSRTEVHERGLWHKAAHIWIVNSKGQLLLQKRSMKKLSSPGLWDISAAGHLSAGDSALDGAVREIEEEVGFTVKPEELITLGTTKTRSVQNNGTYFNNQFSDVYILKKDAELADVKLQESEVDDVRWLSWKDLEKMVHENDPTLVPHKDEYPMLFEYLRIQGY